MERGFLLLLIELLAIFKFCSCFFFLAGLFADWVVCFFRGLCRFCTFACWRFIVDRFWKFRFWRMRLKNYSQFRVKWGRTNVIVSYYWMVCGGDVDLWLARWFCLFFSSWVCISRWNHPARVNGRWVTLFQSDLLFFSCRKRFLDFWKGKVLGFMSFEC